MVVAPDYPAVQCLACQIILMTFMAVQIYNWPWKVPILNVVDMVVCFLLVILVAVAGFYVPAVTDGLKTFFEVFNILALSGLLALVAQLPVILPGPLSMFFWFYWFVGRIKHTYSLCQLRIFFGSTTLYFVEEP